VGKNTGRIGKKLMLDVNVVASIRACSKATLSRNCSFFTIENVQK
jgi:hypothetical protein